MQTIPIRDLPTELAVADAVEAAYRDDLNLIQSKLHQGISTLIECDKQLSIHLFMALRARFKADAGTAPRLRLISGHAQNANDPAAVNQPLMQRILRQLQDAVFSGAENEVIVLPHLDILTTTTRSGLSGETREAAALLHENPNALYLAFKDPSFELPRIIENVFALKHSMIGISRDRLSALILQREARKLAEDSFNPYSLYKYVSGLNAVRLRQILAHFSDRLDFNPVNPSTRDDILREIREMTLVTDVDLPRVDLETEIGGYEKVKKKIRTEILDLLEAKDQESSPERIKRFEELIPKGIIFHGPPGTGKTYFAKAIASSIDATLTVVSGPELKSKWVGESEENLRQVFAQARRSAPSIIVFDELDSFAAARGSYAGSGVEHSMVNQMLTEMDGFRKEELVFVIGTTNFVESLDSALMRPGRFELCIHIPAPNEEDRKAILEIYRKRFELDLSDDVLDYAVRQTAGFADDMSQIRYTGDHLYALARALNREALRQGGTLTVTEKDIDKALGKSDLSRSDLQVEEEKAIAIHEAGHAILAYVLPHCPTIEKITIATGQEETLGYVLQAVKKNKYVTTEDELLDDICVLLGGRIAERLLIGRISVGAFSDLQRANEIARMMVEELAMAPDLGSRTFNSGADARVGVRGAQRRSLAESTAEQVDSAISEILKVQEERACALLEKHRPEMERLVDQLLEAKSMGLDGLKAIFGDQTFKDS